MTGIEQLRKLGADAVRGGEVGRAICDIADQIERERECERDTIENLRLELGEARDEAAWVREHGGMETVEARLMPEGMEWLIEAWPKFEDDAPVKLGDMAPIDGDVDMVEAVQIWIHGKPVIYGDNGSQQLEKGERVKRPAVPAADGEPLDSAERIAEDIRRMAEEWCSHPSLREASEKAASSVGEATMGVALGNLSKRCRALAERERGE